MSCITVFGIKNNYEIVENVSEEDMMKMTLLFELDKSTFDDTYGMIFEPISEEAFPTPELRKAYYRFIFKLFQEWMERNGYDTSGKLDSYDIFVDGYDSIMDFDNPVDAYNTFRFLLNGYEG